MNAPCGVVVFDDGHGRFGPMTDLRACFEIRSGMFTTAGRIAATWSDRLIGFRVDSRLADLVGERIGFPVNPSAFEQSVLFVSGRLPIPDAKQAPGPGEALIEKETGHVVMAHLSASDAATFMRECALPDAVQTQSMDGRVLYRAAWDVIARMKDTIVHDIEHTRVLAEELPNQRAWTMGDAPIKVAQSARVAPNVMFDATNGPIFVDDHSEIRPGAILCGPCVIAGHATVLDQALIKSHTVIGPYSKVAGEVGGTIFQGFSNKSHDGHLGDSWVGKWVNLGAGTTNSNLLNTYGAVPMKLEPDGPREKTGLTFLGSVFGDHVKTAIGTRIMTGTVFGTGAMIALSTPPPTTVGRFAWMTDDGVRAFRLSKFIDVMRTAMARRDRTPSASYLRAIESLHGEHAVA